ncbi:MAG: glyoxalase family protein [Clostridiales bacterium]|jgi:PhnB protein|nr:glyoxalase family protein [Clostridiales bacterium]
MALDIYINYNGNCRNAVEFYAQVFGTESPQILTYGEIPPDPEHPISEEDKNLIMHTRLNINGSNIMFSDVPPGMPFTQGNNITLVIGSGMSIDEIHSIFTQLKEGGTVEMDLQETFWSKCYGSVIDKFGIGWQLSYNEQL